MSDTQLKKPVNLSVNAALLQEAKSFKINLSQAAERGIAATLSESKSEQWKRENAEAIESSNTYVEKHGLPLAKYRQF